MRKRAADPPWGRGLLTRHEEEEEGCWPAMRKRAADPPWGRGLLTHHEEEGCWPAMRKRAADLPWGRGLLTCHEEEGCWPAMRKRKSAADPPWGRGRGLLTQRNINTSCLLNPRRRVIKPFSPLRVCVCVCVSGVVAWGILLWRHRWGGASVHTGEEPLHTGEELLSTPWTVLPHSINVVI